MCEAKGMKRANSVLTTHQNQKRGKGAISGAFLKKEVKPKDRKKEVFQADSKIVNDCYQNPPNFLCDRGSGTGSEKRCILYFSSHNICSPNTEEAFVRQIKEKKFF